MYNLSNLSPSKGSTHARKRKGRGIGSGNGKTAGRGQKGQNSRSGGGVRVGFEGGQMPLVRRLPKFGFYNRFAKTVVSINVRDLNRFSDDTVVDIETLKAVGLVKGRFDFVKLLGQGDLERKLTVVVDRISASAREKVEKAGGKVEIADRRAEVKRG